MKRVKTYSLRETGKILGIELKTVYNLIYRGKLEAIKIDMDTVGSHYVITEESIKNYIYTKHRGKGYKYLGDKMREREEIRRRVRALEELEDELYENLCLVERIKKNLKEWDL